MQFDYFQMVDKIVQLDLDGRSIVVQSSVPEQSTVFEGHFPGYPLTPGVLLIETMAQTSGWLLIALTKFERMAFLAAVKEAKMRNFVRPGQRLTVEAKIIHDGSGFAVTDAKINTDGKLACSAQLTFRHVPFPHPDLFAHMSAQAKRIGFPQDAIPS